ncbi:DUF5017 domain-containing protein [Pedobacter arcticus]|uniref:DUF5017 domain-containing protein n=1 Tax=Pedobacter arcticus TaxID=752140 RepID=UPI0002DA6D21|nr:DUF5017 domain-containing protein [Pedobacter arcticus]
MKYLNFIVVALFVLVSSCSKDEAKRPSFGVSTSTLNYKVGEEIKFDFKGNPDNITFYSGEEGNQYEYRNRTSLPGKLQVEFTSLVDRGLRQNLSLMVTTDISGKVDSSTVKSAKWDDVSSRAIFSTGVDKTPSGIIDLSDFSDTGKPVTIAFKYTDVKTTAQQNRWVIRTFNASSVRENSITSLAVMADAGWLGVSFKNPTAVWTITSAQLLMYGGAVGSEDNEDWVVSKQLDPNVIKSDVGLAIKNISAPLSDFTYKYLKAGVYKVSFLASNRIGDTFKEAIQELTITITP